MQLLKRILDAGSDVWREKETRAEAAVPVARTTNWVTSPNWYALLVKSSQESLVTAKLEYGGLEAFYPHYTVVSADRERRVEKKFFPGYVFVAADLERWNLSAAGIPQIVGIVGLGPHHPLAIPESEVEAVRILAASPLASLSAPCPYLREGDRVRVKYGPLRDMCGFVIRGRGKDRLIVSIEALGQSRSVDVDRNAVERDVERKVVEMRKPVIELRGRAA